MRTPSTKAWWRTPVRAGAVLTLAAGAVLVASSPSYAVVDPITTVAPSRGPSGGTNTITATATGSNTFGSAGATSNGVIFSYNACAAAYPTATVTPAGSGTALTAGAVAATSKTQTNTNKLDILVPAGVVAPGTMASASYYVCVYSGTTGGSSPLTQSTSTAAYTVGGGILTPSMNQGPSGAGTITVTSSVAIATTNAFQFQWAGTSSAPTTCAATAPAAAPIATTGNPPTQTAGVIAVPAAAVTPVPGSTTQVKIAIPPQLALAPGQTLAQYNICLYATSSAAAALVAGTANPYTIAGATLSLGNLQGPSGVISTITASVPNGVIPAGAVAQAQLAGTGAAGSCAPTYTTGTGTGNGNNGYVDATTVRNLSENRVAITLPVGVDRPGSPTPLTQDYWICIYASNSTSPAAPLIAGALVPYTVAAQAAITSVTPVAGNSLGGTRITIVGTDFQTATAVTVGGTPVNITYISPSGTTLIGTVPGHSPGGPFTVSVTTAAGTVNKANAFTFTNGIQAMPNTAPNTKSGSTDVDIIGNGFASLTWTTTTQADATAANAANAHVYLVAGVYDPGDNAEVVKDNGQVDECTGVLVVSDTEIVCQLNLNVSMNTGGTVYSNSTKVPVGTYTLTVVNDGSVVPNPTTFDQTIVSSGSTFTVADY